ncbi:MAG: tetratricopeptide repeat protein [bacterium]|nr:tetratricopeptide repeat protein [bacterium]
MRFILIVFLTFAIFVGGCGGDVARDYYKKATKLSKSKKPEDWEKAIAKFEDIINLKIESYEYIHHLHKKMGNYLRNKGFWNKAVHHYKKALELQPNDYKVHYSLGICYANLGRTQEAYLEKAIEEYYVAIKISPSFEMPYLGLGIIYFFKKGMHKKGIDCLEKAISLEPEFIDAYVTLGKCYYETGNLEKAAASYQKAIKRSPPRIKVVANYYNNLGIVYQTMGDKKQAIDCFQKSLKINPNNQIAIKGLKELGIKVYDRFKIKGFAK